VPFVPHAVILPERSIPEPVFIAALIGVDRLLRIEFNEGSKPLTFARQALARMPRKIPAFGAPRGFVVNYRPDAAIEFDLRGKPLAHFDAAIRPGSATLEAARRPIMLKP
jgi:hypothetical protein